MPKEQKDKYAHTEELRRLLKHLKGKKFILDCGHHVTFGQFLGNNVIILNGSKLKMICTQCGY